MDFSDGGSGDAWGGRRRGARLCSWFSMDSSDGGVDSSLDIGRLVAKNTSVTIVTTTTAAAATSSISTGSWSAATAGEAASAAFCSIAATITDRVLRG